MSCEVNEIVVELEINQAKSVVWDKMLNHFADWWPRDFLCLGESAQLHFEPFAGGRLFETNPEGGCLLWAQVLMIIPGESIDMAGQVTPAFGGPNITMNKMSLESIGEAKTRFRLTNSVLGNVSEEGKASVKSGWEYLMGALKAYCED